MSLIWTLHHVADPQAILRQVGRMLKPDVNVEWVEPYLVLVIGEKNGNSVS